MIERRRHQPVLTPFSLSLRIQWRCVLLVAAALFCASWNAEAFTFVTCDQPSQSGQDAASCVGGTSSEIDESEVTADTLIDACVLPETSCSTGWNVWLPAGLFTPTSPFAYVVEYGSFAPVFGVSTWPTLTAGDGGGGDPGGGDPGSGDMSEVDLLEAGNWFAASFVLVVVLFFMGRGIGLVLDVFRRG